MWLILILLTVSSVWLLRRGLTGRRVGDAVYCARCDYELAGFDAEALAHRRARTEPAWVCPECGTRLVEASQVTVGRLVRRPRSLAAGAVLLLLVMAVVAGRQLPMVANYGSIKNKSDKRLLRDAIRTHEAQMSQPADTKTKTSHSLRTRDLYELYLRAEAGTLDKDVFDEAARAATRFIKAWSDGETDFPPRDFNSGSGPNWWSTIAGIAIYEKRLGLEDRVAFCTATVRVRVRTPERVVRGGPLPIEFLVDSWGPDWVSLTGKPWPSAWGGGAMDFTLRSAAVDGQAIDLVQFDDDGNLESLNSRRSRIHIRPWNIPADEHPRADYSVGRHRLRVEMIARVRYEERLHAGAEGNYASLEALGFPDEGWPIVVETAFEVVENGPVREIVPLRGVFDFEATLEEFSSSSWSLSVRRPRAALKERSPEWMRSGDIFAARITLRAGEMTADLGTWVSSKWMFSIDLPQITEAQKQAILTADPGTAFFVVTPDADIARLVTERGALIATEPIELPIEIKRPDGEGP